MTSAADLDKIIARLVEIEINKPRSESDVEEYKRLWKQGVTELSSNYPTHVAAHNALAAAVAAALSRPPVTVERQGTLDF